MSEEQGWQHFTCSDDELYQGAIAAQTAVEAGECVVIPTDTVYGIAADPFSPEAVQRLLDAKGRGRDMPPPVLVSEPAVTRALATRVPKQAEQLMEAHWPGPLTVILSAQPSLRMDLGDTEGTIALRVPDHEAARVVLRRTGPLAVSSANKTGRPAATDVQDAIDQLGDLVSVYLDDGPTPGPQSSTIVDFTTTEKGVVVREGVLRLEDLQQTIPGLTLSPELQAARDAAAEESGEEEPTDSDGAAPADDSGTEGDADPDGSREGPDDTPEATAAPEGGGTDELGGREGAPGGEPEDTAEPDDGTPATTTPARGPDQAEPSADPAEVSTGAVATADPASSAGIAEDAPDGTAEDAPDGTAEDAPDGGVEQEPAAADEEPATGAGAAGEPEERVLHDELTAEAVEDEPAAPVGADSEPTTPEEYEVDRREVVDEILGGDAPVDPPPAERGDEPR